MSLVQFTILTFQSGLVTVLKFLFSPALPAGWSLLAAVQSAKTMFSLHINKQNNDFSSSNNFSSQPIKLMQQEEGSWSYCCLCKFSVKYKLLFILKREVNTALCRVSLPTHTTRAKLTHTHDK